MLKGQKKRVALATLFSTSKQIKLLPGKKFFFLKNLIEGIVIAISK